MFHIGLHRLASPQHLILLENAEFLTYNYLVLPQNYVHVHICLSPPSHTHTKGCIVQKICHSNMFQLLYSADHLCFDNANVYKVVKVRRGQAPCVCVQNDLTRHSVYILEIAGVLTNM